MSSDPLQNFLQKNLHSDGKLPVSGAPLTFSYRGFRVEVELTSDPAAGVVSAHADIIDGNAQRCRVFLSTPQLDSTNAVAAVAAKARKLIDERFGEPTAARASASSADGDAAARDDGAGP